MATKLGIRMIEKYEEMVRDDFRPLEQELERREEMIREEVTVIVKKELGIYDDYVRKAQIELELEEIEKRLRKWEENEYGPYGGWKSKLDIAVVRKTDEILGGERAKLEEARDEAKANVRLMAIDDDMRDEMRRVRTTVRELKEKYASLPDPTVMLKTVAITDGKSRKKK